MRRTSPMSLASRRLRASDSSIDQRCWDSFDIRLMTREIGRCVFMRKNYLSSAAAAIVRALIVC